MNPDKIFIFFEILDFLNCKVEHPFIKYGSDVYNNRPSNYSGGNFPLDVHSKMFNPQRGLEYKREEKELILSDKTVSIHVRTYSKQVHEEGLHFVGLKFFEEAMNKFPPDSIFVIFSDRTNWCKANFQTKFPDKNFIFIDIFSFS